MALGIYVKTRVLFNQKRKQLFCFKHWAGWEPRAPGWGRRYSLLHRHTKGTDDGTVYFTGTPKVQNTVKSTSQVGTDDGTDDGTVYFTGTPKVQSKSFGYSISQPSAGGLLSLNLTLTLDVKFIIHSCFILYTFWHFYCLICFPLNCSFRVHIWKKDKNNVYFPNKNCGFIV